MNTPNRVIRVPDQLWHAAQAKAAHLGVPLAAVIRDYLHGWVTEDEDAA
jgi:predicted DNA binding CopG/RHH family protein